MICGVTTIIPRPQRAGTTATATENARTVSPEPLWGGPSIRSEPAPLRQERDVLRQIEGERQANSPESRDGRFLDRPAPPRGLHQAGPHKKKSPHRNLPGSPAGVRGELGGGARHRGEHQAVPPLLRQGPARKLAGTDSTQLSRIDAAGCKTMGGAVHRRTRPGLFQQHARHTSGHPEKGRGVRQPGQRSGGGWA